MAEGGRPARGGASAKRAEEVLAAAAELVATRGFDATSMQDVADAVGLLKGSLYYYVSSKDELLLRIIEPGYHAAMDAIAEVLAAPADGTERIRMFVRAHCAFVMDNLTSFTVWMRDFEKLSEQRRAEISAVGDSYYASFRTLLSEAVEEGVVDPSFDVHLLGTTIVGLLNSITQWYHPDGRLTADQVSDHLEALVLAGLASDAAVEAAGGVEALRRTTQEAPAEA